MPSWRFWPCRPSPPSTGRHHLPSAMCCAGEQYSQPPSQHPLFDVSLHRWVALVIPVHNCHAVILRRLGIRAPAISPIVRLRCRHHPGIKRRSESWAPEHHRWPTTCPIREAENRSTDRVKISVVGTRNTSSRDAPSRVFDPKQKQRIPRSNR